MKTMAAILTATLVTGIGASATVWAATGAPSLSHDGSKPKTEYASRSIVPVVKAADLKSVDRASVSSTKTTEELSQSVSNRTTATSKDSSQSPVESHQSTIKGVVGAVSGSSITVKGVTYKWGTTSPQVTSHDHPITWAKIVPGMKVTIKLNAAGHIIGVNVHRAEDQNPEQKPRVVTGKIAAVSTTSQTVTVNSSVYPEASTVRVRYHEYKLPLTALTVGMTVALKVDSAGNVTRITVLNDPALPPSKSVKGTISTVNATALVIDGYTLSYNPHGGVAVHYRDFTLAETALAPGLSVSVKLNSAGFVKKVDILKDPKLPSKKTLVGTLTATSNTSIALDGYTLPMDPNGVKITTRGQDNKTATPSLAAGDTVKVHLNSNGQVKSIKIDSPSQKTIPSVS